MRQSKPSFFLMKNTGAPMGDLDGQMYPFTRFSQRKSSSSFCSVGDRGNVRERGSSVPGERSMAWSHTFCGGSSLKASLEKTSLKSWYWASVARILVPFANRLYGPVLTLRMYHAPYASRIL